MKQISKMIKKRTRTVPVLFNSPLKKGVRGLFQSCALTLLLCTYLSAAVNSVSVSVTDQGGLPRDSFSSTEYVRFEIRGNVTGADSIINYSFKVTDSAGRETLINQKNEMSGTSGDCASSVTGAVKRFFTFSGKYKFSGTIKELNKLTRQVISEQAAEAEFTVTAPYLVLTYPFDGARNLTESPLRFSWVSSGASIYRIYVDDDAAFFNCLLKTGPAEFPDLTGSSFEYPQNPSDSRQKLAAGKVYYWKVEGFDSQGFKIAETRTPFTFSLMETVQVIQVRDMSVEDVYIDPASVIPGNCGLKIVIKVKNLGTQAEVSIPVKMFLNGRPVLPEKGVEMLGAGETMAVEYTLDRVYDEAINVQARMDFFDSNHQNNSKTLSLRTGLSEACVTVPAIKGRVMDEASRTGVPEVSLTLSGPVRKTARTNARGEYEFLKIPFGDYEIKTEKKDYIPRTINYKVSEYLIYREVNASLEKIAVSVPTAAVVTAELPVKKEPGKKIEEDKTVPKILGRVNDKKTGKELAEATVKLDGPTKAETKSKENGTYKFEAVKTGDYTVSAVKDGYESSSVKVKVPDKKAYPNTDIELSAVEVKPAEVEKSTATSAVEKEKPPVGTETPTQKQYTLQETAEKAKTIIKDKDLLKEIENYNLDAVIIDPTSDNPAEIIDGLLSGKIKITKIGIVYE